jgi:hypothetical protein
MNLIYLLYFSIRYKHLVRKIIRDRVEVEIVGVFLTDDTNVLGG